jgi:pimeloyl-ACP methyl ester carboxylesterase
MNYHRFRRTGLILGMLACAPWVGRGAQPTGRETSTVATTRPAELSTGRDEQIRIEVGPPDAKLAAWVLQPKAGSAVKGTVMLLHGFLATHLQVQNAGEALRKAGYRAVLVDLRGFGDSTGQHITFGVLDAQDLKKLTDELQARKLCGPTLGIYGTSMGAAVAILYAAADPRVTSVVAVAPFATIRDEVPMFGRQALPGLSKFLSDEQINTLADSVAESSGMDLDGAKPLEAITKTTARILLIHGDKDHIISHESSVKLQAADPQRSELLTMKGHGHLDLCFDIPGDLQKPTRAWFDKYLAPPAAEVSGARVP